jgi:propanol-preferring alcohol dehydrogenase
VALSKALSVGTLSGRGSPSPRPGEHQGDLTVRRHRGCAAAQRESRARRNSLQDAAPLTVNAGGALPASGTGDERGVGLSLIQVAKLQGGRVLAVSRSPRKLASAGGLGADVVFECVGSEQTMALATQMLGKRGRLVLVGYTEAMLQVSLLSLVVAEQQIRTSVDNTLAELVQAVDLAARGQLRSVVDQVVSLEEINTALGRLRDGDVIGRLVVAP